MYVHVCMYVCMYGITGAIPRLRVHTGSTVYYSLFTFSWPRFESGSLRNGGMPILRICTSRLIVAHRDVWGKLDRRFVD